MAPKIPDNQTEQKIAKVEVLANRFTNWIGSTSSIILHTILFVAAFVFVAFGVALNTVLLVLTTAVSLEAIYLALFIQMTVNKNTQSLEDVAEDVEGIEKDIDEIEKDIDEIQEDVEEIEKDDQEDDLHDEATMKSLNELQSHIQKIMQEIQTIKEQKK